MGDNAKRTYSKESLRGVIVRFQYPVVCFVLIDIYRRAMCLKTWRDLAVKACRNGELELKVLMLLTTLTSVAMLFRGEVPL